MRRPDDEPLALERLEAYEPPELPGEADGPRHAQPTDTDELRSELASLEARLASYPTPLAEQLDQARALRTSAEADLELADGRLAEFARENEGSRWWRRRAADPRAVAMERLRRGQAERDIGNRHRARARARAVGAGSAAVGGRARAGARARGRAAHRARRAARAPRRALSDPPIEIWSSPAFVDT